MEAINPSQHRLAPQAAAAPYEQCLAEVKSLQSFKQLLLLSIEALELWRIMSVHQFYTIVESQPPELTEKLKQVIFAHYCLILKMRLG